MKTFIKLLVGFVAGFGSCFVFIAWVVDEIQNNPEKHTESCSRAAEWVRNMGYDVKESKENDNDFKMGFH